MESVIGGRVAGVPHFDIPVDPQDIDTTCKPMMKCLMKDWNVKDMVMKEFSGGISNKLVGYFVPGEYRVNFIGGKPVFQ